MGCSLPVFAQEITPGPLPGQVVIMEDEEFTPGPGPEIAIAAPIGIPDMDMAIAAGHMGGHGGMFGGLHLTDDQYEKLFAIKRDHMLKAAGSCGQMAAAHIALHDAMMAPTIDAAKVHAAQNTINQLKNAQANARLDMMIAMANVLTPEQREELHKRMIHRMVDGGFGGGNRMYIRHHGGPGGPGGMHHHEGPAGAGHGGPEHHE
jgi:Spy/CpxP family protein refolding chaperone